MSPPIRDGLGNDIGSIRLGDGSEIAEVRTGAGDVLFSAVSIPPSAILNLVGKDYDSANNSWVANIGPNVSDASGDPSTTTITDDGGQSRTAVQYQRSNQDASQTTAFSVSDSKVAIIYTTERNGADDGYKLDGGTANEFVHLNKDGTERIFSGAGTDVTGGSADLNLHTYCLEGDKAGPSFELFKDTLSQPLLTGSNFTKPTGLTLAGKADFSSGNFEDQTFVELTVLEGHTQAERDSEFNRQRSKYGT